MCVNNAKDHNGRLMKIDRSSIESTGKKVMIFLLLAGYVEERDKGGALACSRTKFSEVHSYLSKKKSNKMEIDTFYYIPGRCVSLKQLCEANKRYKNHITDTVPLSFPFFPILCLLSVSFTLPEQTLSARCMNYLTI